MRPAIAGTARATSRPELFSSSTRSSHTSRANPAGAAARSSRARRDFPLPDGPRISTPASPTATHVACTVCCGMSDNAGREADGEARADAPGLAVLVDAVDPVLGDDAAPVRLDDLARDRQPEAGILPEARLRPVGVEALEHALEGMRRDAGPVVLDGDVNVAADPAQTHANRAVGRG